MLRFKNIVCERKYVGACQRGASGGGGALPYMGYIGMCCSEGYGFQVVYSRIRYINQRVWV